MYDCILHLYDKLWTLIQCVIQIDDDIILGAKIWLLWHKQKHQIRKKIEGHDALLFYDDVNKRRFPRY